MGASIDNDPDFTDDFCHFIQRCVSNVDAAEILLTLFEHADRSWNAAEICVQLAPAANLSEPDAQRYLDVFQSCGLATVDAHGRIRYRPLAAHDPHLVTLSRLYVERPVTLFRVIYALRDTKINTFADAFKLRR